MQAPYMSVYLVISQPKIPYIHRVYMVLANPSYMSYLDTPYFRMYGSGQPYMCARRARMAKFEVQSSKFKVSVQWMRRRVCMHRHG